MYPRVTQGIETAAETLTVMTKTRYVRYLLTVCWGLCVAGVLGPVIAMIWFACAGLALVARTLVERWTAGRQRGYGVIFPLVATLTVAVWAAAPLLCWFAPAPHGKMIALALLGCGFLSVFSQFRGVPRYAALVSSPYILTEVIFAVSLWGQDPFWSFLASCLALTGALTVYQAMSLAAKAEEARLIAQLKAARDEADRANAAKSAFLGVVSHELRTPMNGVLGAAQLLTATPLAPEQSRYLDIIRDSGDGLLTLLNDMLDMTKIEAGAMTLDVQPTELSGLIDRVAGPWSARATTKGLDFEVIRGDGLPVLVGIDEHRVVQILQNLLNNAVKFTDQGKVSLEVSVMSTAPGEARIRFAVIDTGVGIAPEDARRLFQPFVQVDGSATRRFAGTGLGLNICRRLAELMGGSVEVRSQPGTGSNFQFELTVEADWITREAEAVETPSGADQRPLRVLVVEDHPVNRYLLDSWLSASGHAVTLAGDGQEGLDAADIQAYDLILMDVQMPVLDGLTATRRLRAGAGPNRDTPLVVLSASARVEDHENGLSAGADGYLTKPIDFADLARLMARCHDGREAVREAA